MELTLENFAATFNRLWNAAEMSKHERAAQGNTLSKGDISLEQRVENLGAGIARKIEAGELQKGEALGILEMIRRQFVADKLKAAAGAATVPPGMPESMGVVHKQMKAKLQGRPDTLVRL